MSTSPTVATEATQGLHPLQLVNADAHRAFCWLRALGLEHTTKQIDIDMIIERHVFCRAVPCVHVIIPI